MEHFFSDQIRDIAVAVWNIFIEQTKLKILKYF